MLNETMMVLSTLILVPLPKIFHLAPKLFRDGSPSPVLSRRRNPSSARFQTFRAVFALAVYPIIFLNC